MCLISVLKSGTEKDTEEVYEFIKNGYTCNRQGSGYMFKRAGGRKIHLKKGFFTLQKLLDSIKEQKLQKDDELVVHHRIGNIGYIDEENCHPFVISKNHNEVISRDISTYKPCLAHNGTFTGISFYRNMDITYSDTYAFSRYIMSNEAVLQLFKTDKQLFDITMSNIINTSRIVVMFPDRPLEMIGDFIENKGYFHSNTGYEDITVYNYGGYGSYYGDSYDKCVRKDANYYKQKWEEDLERSQNKFKNQENLVDTFLREAKDALKEKEESRKLNNVLLLEDTIVKLTPFNYKDFWVIKKIRYDESIPEEKLVLQTVLDFDPDCLVQKVERKTAHTSIIHTIPTSDLVSNYYYIPKTNTVRRKFSDYLVLVDSLKPKDIGGKTLKKVEKMLNNKWNKSGIFEVYYKRFDKHFTKDSLILFKEYLEKVLNQKKEEWDNYKKMTFSD